MWTCPKADNLETIFLNSLSGVRTKSIQENIKIFTPYKSQIFRASKHLNLESSGLSVLLLTVSVYIDKTTSHFLTRVRGDKGQGETGDTGGGATTRTRGN